MNTAIISPDEKYRYMLSRDTGLTEDGAPGHCSRIASIAFVMLNPSTADASVDDPTIRRCVAYAKKWGAAELLVVNLYALRATDPKDLWKSEDPVGPMNDLWLQTILQQSAGVLCAWGVNAKQDRVDWFVAEAAAQNCALWCLTTTKDNAPGHPLFLPAALEPKVYDND